MKDNTIKFYTGLEYAGMIRIGGPQGLHISLVRKPRWLHRKMMLWCFGWEWVDRTHA